MEIFFIENPVVEELKRKISDPATFEKMSIHAPCIMVFDSLADKKGKIYNTIREYLQVEYKVRLSRLSRKLHLNISTYFKLSNFLNFNVDITTMK